MAIFDPANLRKFLENMVEPTTADPNVQNKSELNPERSAFEKWKSPQFGGKQMVSTNQIAGQKPMNGTDILKYLRKHDPKNTAGSVKDGLNILTKFHKVTEQDNLLSSIVPQQNILGGKLYSQMLSAGSKSKSQKKTQSKKTKKPRTPPPDTARATPQELQEYEDSQYEEIDEQTQLLINKAIDCTEMKRAEVLPIVAEQLSDNEVEKIQRALYVTGKYESVNMPGEFVDCVNNLLKSFMVSQNKERKYNV